MKSDTDKVFAGISWSLAGDVLAQVITWVFTLLIARILSPNDYGLVGMAGIYMVFALKINEMGIGATLIQNQDISRPQIGTVYSFALVISSLFVLMTFVLAQPYADFFQEPKLVMLLRVASVTFFINTAVSIQQNLLAKEMKFKQLAVVSLLARVISILSGFGCAVIGFGVWTLVAQHIMLGGVSFIGTFWLTRLRPGALSMESLRALQHFLRFGGTVLTTGVINYFANNIDRFYIGKILGKTQLGVYELAFTLASKPFEKLLSVFNRVFFPFFAKIQHDDEKIRYYFFKKIRFELILLMPVFVGITLLSREIVLFFLGEKWLAAVMPLQVVSAIGLFRYFDAVLGIITVALGYPKYHRNFQIVLFVVMAIFFYLLINIYGLTGILIVWGVMYPLLVTAYLYIFAKLLHLPFLRIIGLLGKIGMAIAVMVAAVLMTKSMTIDRLWVAMVCQILAGGGAYMLMLHGVDREFYREAVTLVRNRFSQTSR